MPHYVYHFHDGRTLLDQAGAVLPSSEAARDQASMTAGAMLIDLSAAFWESPEWRMDVTDEQGATVGTLVCKGTMGTA